jgi:hypothetical protein
MILGRNQSQLFAGIVRLRFACSNFCPLLHEFHRVHVMSVVGKADVLIPSAASSPLVKAEWRPPT